MGETNEPLSHITEKLNLKWIGGLNVRARTIELLEENRYKIHNLGLGKGFLDPESINKEKEQIIKIKTVCASKDAIQTMTATRRRGKITADQISGKGPVSRM